MLIHTVLMTCSPSLLQPPPTPTPSLPSPGLPRSSSPSPVLPSLPVLLSFPRPPPSPQSPPVSASTSLPHRPTCSRYLLIYRSHIICSESACSSCCDNIMFTFASIYTAPSCFNTASFGPALMRHEGPLGGWAIQLIGGRVMREDDP